MSKDPIAKIRRWRSKLNEGTTTYANVSYLLERVSQLERENKELRSVVGMLGR